MWCFPRIVWDVILVGSTRFCTDYHLRDLTLTEASVALDVVRSMEEMAGHRRAVRMMMRPRIQWCRQLPDVSIGKPF